MGCSVFEALQCFFRTEEMLSKVNNSLIVLIPKIQAHLLLNISNLLVCVIRCIKIISKLIVSRLRPLLHKMVAPNQSTFILGRWIAENQILVQEVLHSFKKRKVKGGFVGMKVELQKAYDRVDWRLLKAVLIKFGFTNRFVKWICECVSIVSSSVLINEGKSTCFKPTRGLRQCLSFAKMSYLE